MHHGERINPPHEKPPEEEARIPEQPREGTRGNIEFVPENTLDAIDVEDLTRKLSKLDFTNDSENNVAQLRDFINFDLNPSGTLGFLDILLALRTVAKQAFEQDGISAPLYWTILDYFQTRESLPKPFGTPDELNDDGYVEDGFIYTILKKKLSEELVTFAHKRERGADERAVFVPSDNTKLDEEDAAFLHILKENHITDAVEHKLGIKLENLGELAQIRFLSYIAGQSNEGMDWTAELFEKYTEEERIQICYTLLAFTEYPELSYTLFSFCEDPEYARPVIKIVSDILRNVDKTEEFLRAEFKSEGDHKAIDLLRKKLIERADSVLNTYLRAWYGYRHKEYEISEENTDSKKLPAGEKERIAAEIEELKNALAEKAKRDLQYANADQVLFMNAFKTLKDQGKLRLEDVRGVSLVTGRYPFLRTLIL